MPRCFGNGNCIKKRTNGYYKPFKCPYNCKLVACYNCKNVTAPLWLLQQGAGSCSECLKLKFNDKMMQKLFVHKNLHVKNQ